VERSLGHGRRAVDEARQDGVVSERVRPRSRRRRRAPRLVFCSSRCNDGSGSRLQDPGLS
jgi:hypothetical protein